MHKFDYTQRARRFVYRYPFLNSIIMQTSFWVLANLALALLLHLVYSSVNANIPLPLTPELGPVLVIGLILGICYGVVQGITDYLLEKQFFRKRSLGITFILKIVVSLLTLGFLFGLVRFVLFDRFILPMMFEGRSPMSDVSWKYTFYIFLLYYFIMTMVITFIIQVNKKYGPGVLLPLLLGKYRQPREEERIFMFMDLKSSTSIAEQLGHLRYSSFIRDSFSDINEVIGAYRAEIYQYVGDEIVLSWRVTDGLDKLACIRFYFACGKQFDARAGYYTQRYGMIPFFKAGVHMGPVTAVEIGEMKRDIAYHGDTINTAARIQSLCNSYDKSLLVSNLFTNHPSFATGFFSSQLGKVTLKGKLEPVELLSVDGCIY
jgi:adenylate cyclase